MPVLEERDLAVVTAASLLVTGVLDELGPHLLRRTGDVASVAKSDGTPVTAIDHEVDDRLAAAIHARFPSHGVLSEERDTVAPDTEWTWIIDPIDGTSNFTAGLPWWCVSIALALNGVPVLGVIDAPALDRRYLGVRDRGATRGTRPLQVRQPVDWRSRRFRHLPVMLTTGTARRVKGAGIRLNPRVMGSAALDLAVVAEGIAVASVAIAPHVWDVAAGMVIVEAAGGALVTPRGTPWAPLQPGVEHQDLATATAAAGTASYATELVEVLLAQP